MSISVRKIRQKSDKESRKFPSNCHSQGKLFYLIKQWSSGFYSLAHYIEMQVQYILSRKQKWLKTSSIELLNEYELRIRSEGKTEEDIRVWICPHSSTVSLWGETLMWHPAPYTIYESATNIDPTSSLKRALQGHNPKLKLMSLSVFSLKQHIYLLGQWSQLPRKSKILINKSPAKILQ